MVRRTFRLPAVAWSLSVLGVLGGVAHMPSAAAQTAPLVCDADFDRDIDRNDLTLINAGRGQSARRRWRPAHHRKRRPYLCAALHAGAVRRATGEPSARG
jgi:hypothetical protein